jgi:hypothetical protein
MIVSDKDLVTSMVSPGEHTVNMHILQGKPIIH